MKGTPREEGEGGDVHEAPEALEGKGKLTRDGTRGQGTLQQSRRPALTDLKGHREGRADAVCVQEETTLEVRRFSFYLGKHSQAP